MLAEGISANAILVVDDEPQVVWVLQFSLEAEGYQTFSARDGVQAMSAIGEHHPKLMVLDEPTVGLDPVLREQLWSLFRRLADSGATIIISSHVMDEAERCDDLLLLRDGQV